MERRLLVSSGLVGLTSVATQVIFLREFLSAFSGNELVIGLVLASWMVLTGAGAFLGKSLRIGDGRPRMVVALLVLLSILPPLTVFLLRFLRNLVFAPGSQPGLAGIIGGSIFFLLPFCVVSGIAFPLIAHLISVREGETALPRVYSWETFGSALGGLAVSVFLIALLDAFQIMLLLFCVNLATAMWIELQSRRRAMAGALGLLMVAGAAAAVTLDPGRVSRQFLFPGQRVVLSMDTPYGNLTVTRVDGQTNLFENSVPLPSGNDLVYAEEGVHYAAVQRRSLKRVLMIGGVTSGSVPELLKYPVERIDIVEIDPWLIEVAGRLGSLADDRRVRVINEDARMYVERTAERYDMVLVNLPDPGTARINRYFTSEFFGRVKALLTRGGVMESSLLPGAEYQGPDARLLVSVHDATLRRWFSNVLIVPGERHIFLASDSALSIAVAGMIEGRGIATAYVNRFYIDDELLGKRSRAFAATLVPAGTINTDFRPACYYRQLEYWLGSFGASAAWFLVPLAGAFILAFFRSGPLGAGIVAAGMVTSSLEVVLLLALQVMCGSLYQMTGVVVAAFMAGLGTGSRLAVRIVGLSPISLFMLLQLVLALICFSLPLLLSGVAGAGFTRPALYFTLAGISFLIAMVPGMEFSAAASARRGPTMTVAAELYGLDLFGGAAGALLVAVYVLPRFGISGVSLLLGLLSAAGALWCFGGRKRIALDRQTVNLEEAR